MRHKLLLIFTLTFIFSIISCSKDNDNQGSIVIEEPEEDVFVEADPDLNVGMITFEETGPSFKTENWQPEDRTQPGNWSYFGGVGDINISVAYADNPSKGDGNNSERVVHANEPVGVQSWSGFYFMLEEKINFPSR